MVIVMISLHSKELRSESRRQDFVYNQQFFIIEEGGKV